MPFLFENPYEPISRQVGLGLVLAIALTGDAGAQSALAAEPLSAAPATAGSLWLGLGALVCFALGALGPRLLRLLRGESQIRVEIDYPPELRGLFRVQRRGAATPESERGRLASAPEANEARRAAGGSSERSRFDISRETQFLRVPPGRHFVSADGFVRTAVSEDVVAAHFGEQEVRTRRGETCRLKFDFEPRACPVEVRVRWDGKPVQEALVARSATPGSLRVARGAVQVALDRGHHRLVAGHDDRVAGIRVEVESFQPRIVEIELGDHAQLLFIGCPGAVAPFLNGDVAAAARVLEQEGQREQAHQILADFHREQGRAAEAAYHYEQAGDPLSAAEIHESESQPERAALLYECAAEDQRAGEMYRLAGKAGKAGECFLRANALDTAAECFRDAGDVQRWIEALTKQGAHFAAAKIALEQGRRSQAIGCLERVDHEDGDYPEATVLLAEAYQREQQHDLARKKLEELLVQRPEEEVPSEALDRLARLCEQAGDHERALHLLERLRRRDASWPQLGSRIETLRKARSSQTTQPDTSSPTHVTDAFGDAFRYEILEEVGRGGMGVVFRARDRRLGREVALKRLPDHIKNHPKAVELFLREARAAAALNHPNIVTLFDAGQDAGTYYMTMELLQGLPLQKVLRERGPLQPGFVTKLAGQIARGLEYAHEQGIVHRDIKTANLFFTEKKIAKIMDFGLAKMLEEVRRSTTVVGGTPYYMAPEQSSGERVDHRSDLYAFGITLFELLTGSVPFKEGDVAFHHRHTAVPDLRDKVEEIPEALALLVEGLLEKDPDERIRSAGEVVRRLAGIARGGA